MCHLCEHVEWTDWNQKLNSLGLSSKVSADANILNELGKATDYSVGMHSGMTNVEGNLAVTTDYSVDFTVHWAKWVIKRDKLKYL